MKKILSLVTIFPLLLLSCMEDKGSYEYNELNKITIEPIGNQVVHQYNEDFRIVPVIKQSNGMADHSNLSYRWNINGKLWCTNPVFDAVVTLAPTNNALMELFVFDDRTGIFTKSNFSLQVQSALGEGLMVLGTSNGVTTLDYFRSDGQKILDMQNSIEGGIGSNPQNIYYNEKVGNIEAIVWCMCDDEKGGVIISATTLNKIANHNDWFFLPEQNPKPQSWLNDLNYQKRELTIIIGSMMWRKSSTFDFVCTNGEVCERSTSKGKFSPPYLSSDNKGYEASPFLMTANTSPLLYIYDRKNRRFLERATERASYTSNYLRPVTVNPQNMAYDPSNVGENMELVFSGLGYGTVSNQYMIFHNGVTYYYMKAEFSADKFIAKEKCELPFTADSRTKFAISNAKPSLMYTVNDREIWNMDTETKGIMKRYDDFEADEKITMIYFYPSVKPNSKGQMVWDNRLLYVAVKGSATNGKASSIYALKVNDDNTLTRLEKISNITDDIVSITWKS